MGEHTGAHLYTSGQRKRSWSWRRGGGGGDVVRFSKNIETNEVFVVRGSNHPALFVNDCEVQELNSINTDFFKNGETKKLQGKIEVPSGRGSLSGERK